MSQLPSPTEARRPETGWGANLRAAQHLMRMTALLTTVPAFYLELLYAAPTPLASASYAFAAFVVGLAVWIQRRHRPPPSRTVWSTPPSQWFSMSLVLGLLLAALLPPSATSGLALGVRSVTALLTLGYVVWSLQRLLARGSLPVLLALAMTVLALCGLGFWWLEPRATTLADGMWLAFTTAATVGYGDIVPTTPASKIFAVFVVLLGFGVLSLVTASIAAMWVESHERQIEREILHDLHRQVRLLRDEVRSLRQGATGPAPAQAPVIRDS